MLSGRTKDHSSHPSFQAFLHREVSWPQVCHETSTPHHCYTQSNGWAKAAVKSMKKLKWQTWDIHAGCDDEEAWTRVIVQYCNTPSPSDYSVPQHTLPERFSSTATHPPHLGNLLFSVCLAIQPKICYQLIVVHFLRSGKRRLKKWTAFPLSM